MRPYTVVLGAGVPMPIQAGGEYFLIDSAPLGGLKVEFFGSGNVKRDQFIEGGKESTWGRIRGGFASLKLTSTGAQTVTFYVADGEMGRNVFSGSSDVTDRAARLLGLIEFISLTGDKVTEAGNAFAVGFSAAASAGNFQHSQLKNPAASGKVVLLDEVHFSSSAAETFSIARHNTDLTTLVSVARNRDVGAADSTAQLRNQAAVATLYAAPFYVFSGSPANGHPSIVRFAPPLRLEAGEGVAMGNGTVNVVHRATYFFREY